MMMEQIMEEWSVVRSKPMSDINRDGQDASGDEEVEVFLGAY